ncbi:DUF4440 domain-containing protein [Adhaeribacter swui]|uniref:DUF4440 domain-containing protein n=1 Tax=Adhaeribacter swui TaxID=2086471 RepID=A0A7G7GCQ4_9BACT|nr:DUF4440 domain-containing protein [Adhaeribacter swui]QNF34938.1 DUF4440 domain-containing protein [Adhaeribacter swui]
MSIYENLKIRYVLLLLTSCLSFGISATAQTPVEEVITTELAFAKLAVDQDTRAAFLAYMSDNSLLERQGKLIKGRPVYLQLPPDTSGKLIWYPTIATSSAAGDLGYTSGPYSYQVKGKAVAFGDFATVWEKHTNQKWTFVIDLGNSYEPIKEQSPPGKIEKINPANSKNLKNSSTDLLKIDQNLNAQIQLGLASAYVKVLHPSARLLRTGKPPYTTTAEKETLFAQKVTLQFKPEGYRIASSNDLGVVYGSCTLLEPNSDTAPQQGAYMHVWRKDAQKGWQLLHESINLAPKN